MNTKIFGNLNKNVFEKRRNFLSQSTTLSNTGVFLEQMSKKFMDIRQSKSMKNENKTEKTKVLIVKKLPIAHT